MQSITDVLQNSHLGRIVRQANSINELNDKIRQRLPQTYRLFYRISSLRGGVLTFEVQSATVRQGLQMQQAELLHWVQQDFPQVKSLAFTLNPNFTSP